MDIEASPIGNRAFGVRVRGVSFERLRDGSVRDFLRAALDESGLVILEDVEPSNRLQGLVGEVFGSLKDYRTEDGHDGGAGGTTGIAEMVTGPRNCTIVEVAGRRLAGWMPWHFDQPYNRRPNPARVLRCGKTVPSGGLTGFIDGAELYRKIDAGLREEIERCSVNYAFNLTLNDLRFGVPAGFRVVKQASAAGRARPCADQNASHPAVRVAPTGRKILHVSPWMATGIAGRADGSGDELLEAVAQEILTLSETVAYFHQWRLTDVLIWDNLRMLHSSSGFDPGQTRIMYRTTIQAH